MGTNVYYYKKLTEEIKNQIIEEVKTSDNWDMISENLEYFKEKYSEYKEIHVGKRSAGWKFLFAREILRYCEPNKESICNWLSTGEIINEYGDKLTPETFWKEYVENFQNGINSDEYYEKHPEDIRWKQFSQEEMIGDLRFTSKEYDFC